MRAKRRKPQLCRWFSNIILQCARHSDDDVNNVIFLVEVGSRRLFVQRNDFDILRPLLDDRAHIEHYHFTSLRLGYIRIRRLLCQQAVLDATNHTLLQAIILAVAKTY